MSSFSRESEFTKFVSEEIATARSRHASRWRRIPMPASPRHRARCNRHEARAGSVALTSCCLARLSSGGLGLLIRLLSHYQRARSEVFAVVPLLRAALAGWPSVAISAAAAKLFFVMLNGTSITDPEPVNFLCDPESWAYGRYTPETSAKDIISARISFAASAAVVPLLDWLPACVADDFCNPDKPDALGNDSSSFAVTQQLRACVRRMLRRKLACMLPPSSLDPRLASGTFAVAKDEGRDRFIGDRRPLNSRERSIVRAHLPCCPRLRRIILGESETVQITTRDTKDLCHLYEVPPSRVVKQMIGPRIPRS